MAGEGTPIDSFSNRVLWQFISGSGVLRPKKLIEHEITKNKHRLLSGLLHYKPTGTGTPGEKLKKERKVVGRQLEFVLKLSKFLDVDELLCHDLFCAFLVNDYRGSKKSLKQVLSHERHSQALILKIRDFYYTERLYLLRCLHHIFLYWDLEHPYQDVYAKFMKGLLENGENLQDKVQKQLASLCGVQPPTQEKNGVLMTNAQVLTWVTQNLKEQCELLEVVLILNRDCDMKAKTLLSYISLFKGHGFGAHQTYKHHVDESTEKYIKRISYLEVLIVLEAIDVDQAMTCWTNHSFVEYNLSRKEDFQAVHNELCTLGSDSVHGPVLLGWSMVRHFYQARDPSSKETMETHKLGNRALHLGAFKVLLDLLSTESFSGTGQHVACLAHYMVYKLLYAVLSVFQEDTLGNPAVLYEICNKLLCQPAIAQDVWQKDDGVWLLYESAMAFFPLDFQRFIKMTAALATATSQSATMVKSTLKELSIYTEYLDNNSARDLQPTQDPSVFMLTSDKRPYPVGDFTLQRGSCGQVLELSALPRSMSAELAGPLMRWEAQYNGWSLLLAEVMELLQQITHGAGTVQVDQVQKVTLVLELLHQVLKAETASSVREFAPFIDLCYDLVHRFSVLNPAPLDLLSGAVNCIACAAKHFPGEVWHKVMQTGLLPYLTENVDDLGEVLSGRGLHAGMLGSIEAGTECTQARYPLTLTVLNMLTNLVKAFSKDGKEEELQACLLHILKEVFPLFRKWRYTDLTQRKQIGQQCLSLFHKVLNLADLQKKTDKPKPKTSRPSLHEVCVYSLLFTEAGRALIEIVATGVDNVEVALVHQGSLTEGSGVDLIELIQLSLSVLNRLLLLRSPNLPLSPVEQALSWQPAGRQSQHVVATVAQYIYHRHNPKLPTLATLLLKRLAMMSPMSILACLGNDAEPIRDIYLTRLQALSEDLRLKVAILELLSVCVETQPGLIEIFFDVQMAPSESVEGKKGLQLGRSSCLQTLLTLMEVQKQTTYHCPPDLLRSGLDLVHSLWRGRRETAMEVLRSKQSFWASVVAPLKRDVTEPEMITAVQLQPTEVKIAAFSFRILAQEIYAVEGSRVDPQLKGCLQDLGKNNRLAYWSKFMRECLLRAGSQGAVAGAQDMSDSPTILLMKAWRNFLLVVSRSKLAEDLQLNEVRKEQVMAHLLEGLQAQFSGRLTLLNMKLATIITALYYTLLKSWGSCVGKPAAIMVGLRGALEQTISNSESLMPTVQIGLVAALTLLLQRARLDTAAVLAQPAISTLLPITCSLLLHSTRQLSAPVASSHSRMQDASSDEGKSKTDRVAESRIKLQVAVCSLLTEIVLATDPHTWLPAIQEHGVMAALLVSLEAYIKAKQGLPYVHSGLLLLAAVADSEKGAAMLSLSDFTSHTCLAITNLYTNEDIFATPVMTPKVSGVVTPSSTTWHSLFCLSIDLNTLLLQRLGFSFLEDALNFLGAHQDRLQQSLDLARLTLLDSAMMEAESTCNFLHQMALYRRQWRLHLPNTINKVLSSMLGMIQTFISLLIRPRYLQHILERGHEVDKGKQSLQSSPLLQHQTSTDDVDQPSSQLLATENSMLRIMAKCLAVLRQFSPDLCQVLLDQSMDMCEYDTLVDLAFSSPSVDQESPLTFGSLISCVTACLSRLHKEHKAPSPHRLQSPHRKSPRPPAPVTEPPIPKALLQFVMENCLTLAMTQACRYLREPTLYSLDKQLLKRELSTELNSFLTSIHRHMRRGGAAPGSPGDKPIFSSPHAGGGSAAAATTTSAATAAPTTSSSASVSHVLTRSLSQPTFSASSHDQQFFRLVQEFVKKVLR